MVLPFRKNVDRGVVGYRMERRAASSGGAARVFVFTNWTAWLKSNWVLGTYQTIYTTLSNGYLGSHNDEERSEMRYVMRIAEFSESSNL